MSNWKRSLRVTGTILGLASLITGASGASLLDAVWPKWTDHLPDLSQSVRWGLVAIGLALVAFAQWRGVRHATARLRPNDAPVRAIQTGSSLGGAGGEGGALGGGGGGGGAGPFGGAGGRGGDAFLTITNPTPPVSALASDPAGDIRVDILERIIVPFRHLALVAELRIRVTNQSISPIYLSGPRLDAATLDGASSWMFTLTDAEVHELLAFVDGLRDRRPAFPAGWGSPLAASASAEGWLTLALTRHPNGGTPIYSVEYSDAVGHAYRVVVPEERPTTR